MRDLLYGLITKEKKGGEHSEKKYNFFIFAYFVSISPHTSIFSSG
jgi:hypothetical protein